MKAPQLNHANVSSQVDGKYPHPAMGEYEERLPFFSCIRRHDPGEVADLCGYILYVVTTYGGNMACNFLLF